MTRPTDAEVMAHRATINGATLRTSGVKAAETCLEMDHDQARAHVKSLSQMLARVLTQLPGASLVDEAEALVNEVSP